MEIQPKNNKKLITFSDRSLEMAEAIGSQIGINKLTQIVARGIEELYKQTFKYGKDPFNEGGANDSEEVLIKKAVRKVKASQTIKEEQDKARLEPKINTCLNILGGEIETNENGHKFCRYTSYTLKDEQSQLIPINQVDPVLAETSLFIPSREAIFNNRPEVAKRFSSLGKK